MTIALVVLAIFLLLLASEYLWRKRNLRDEISRKFVHLTVGTFVAFWPFFLSWDTIKILSVAFLTGVLISKYFNIFQAIHSVQRPTWGELFFAAIVGILAFVTHYKWIYAVSLLQMSLADGLAAVIGEFYGKKQRYHVFGHAKSVAGTLTFFVVSFLLLVFYSLYSGTHLSLSLMLELSFGAALLENLAVHGFDNLLVPLMVALVLTQIR
jgi:phytol kinase